jgi:cytochrome c biogenesis protein ResB
MAQPVCPPDYNCTFTSNPPDHVYDHWWDGPWGTFATIIAIVAVTFVLCWLAYYWYATVQDRRERHSVREERDYTLALSEQFTAQIDMAKGDPEMLKIVQSQQSRWGR